VYIFLKKNILNNPITQIFFITFSLLSVVTFGTTLFKYIISSIFFLSIFYIEFKNFDKVTVILNSFAILIILFFVKIETMTIIFCVFLFYGFFKFNINLAGIKSLQYNKNKFYFLILFLFLISTFYNLKPHQENYFIYLSSDEVEKISNGQFSDEILVNKSNEHKDSIFYHICIINNDKNKNVINDKCNKFSNFFLYNRLSTNNLDPNLFSLVTMFVIIFLLKISIPKRRIILLSSSILFFIIIEFFTKSRVLFIYFSLYIFFEYFLKNKHLNFLKIFLSFNVAIFLFVFLSGHYLSNFDYNISYNNPIYRLIDIFDDSIKIRFLNISNSLIYQLQNFNEIIFPGSDKHFNSTQVITKFNNYSPHNFMLALIKDYGLLVTLVIILNIKYLFDKSLSSNFLSLLLSLSFLGYSILFIFIFILFERIYNFKTQFTNLKKNY
jgi:hypothetical protein